MPKIALSDFGLRSLTVPSKGQCDYWDARFPAFGVRVSQGGSKTFVLNIHNSRRSIGRYPIVSLAEARVEARRQLAEKTLGKVRPQSITFAAALELFLDEKKQTRRHGTWVDLRLRLNQYFTFKGQLSDFTHREASRRLARIKTNSCHDHALATAKTFFTWAMNRRYITDSPVRGLSPRGHTPRTRVLSDAELRLIWRACEQNAGEVKRAKSLQAELASSGNLADLSGTLPTSFCKIVQLLMLTGQRRGEIAALQTTWLQDTQITLPADVTKNGRSHTFPISTVSQALLTAGRSSSDLLLFPARGKPKQPFNGWSKSKAALDKLSGVTAWTLHDLRRTFATRLAAFAAPHVVEKLLNHVSGTISGVSAIYNRFQYEAECRAAMEEWEHRLLAIVNDPSL